MRQLKMVAADWGTLTRPDSDNTGNHITALNARDTFEHYRAWQDFRCVEIYRQVTTEPIDTSRSTTYTNNIYVQGFTPYGSTGGLRGLPTGLRLR